jgi:solute carrier family 25 aspartate/glutamate transporter 12/13
MEASIIFHFAGRGSGAQRLSLMDFGQLLDPRWRAPHDDFEAAPKVTTSFVQGFFHSAYSFVQGGLCWGFTRCSLNELFSGIAGGIGATIVYPIDMGS